MVLLRLSGLDMLDDNPLFPGPFQQLSADVFRAVVDTNGARFTAPFHDPVEASNDPRGGCEEGQKTIWEIAFPTIGKIDLDAQPFAVEIVQHVQQPERPAVTQPVGHEVHRPGYVQRIGHRQGVGFVRFQPFARLDTKVQVQFAVNPVNPFVVPGMALDIAQVQKT